MNRILVSMIEMVAAAVFLIPFLCVYEKCFFHNRKHIFFYLIFAFYLVAVFALVGFPTITTIQWNLNFNVNLIPFRYLIVDLKNACLNVILFIPFGIFLPLFWKKFRTVKNILAAGLCFTVLIEIMQIFTFRATDINDIMTNVLGTWIGFCLIKGITKNFSRYILYDTKEKEMYLIFGTVVVVMFYMQPFVSGQIWQWVYS